MTFNEAYKCASSLKPPDDRESLSKTTSLIASALTLIAEMSHFVEESARGDSTLGILSLAVFAKTKQGSVIREFSLWGPRLPSPPVPDAEIPAEEGLAQQACNEPMFQPLPSCESRSQTANIANLPDRPRAGPKPHIYQENESSVLVQSPSKEPERDASAAPSVSGESREETEVFRIDEIATAKCLSLLCDASGITSHLTCHNSFTLRNVSSEVLTAVIRNSMTSYKKMKNIEAKVVKYSSLIPIEFRNREVIFSNLALIRNGSGSSVLRSSEKAKLAIRKPDRNKKELHFAVCALLLQLDPDGICYQELNSLALKGLSENGCKYKPGVKCGGPLRCCESSILPASRLFNGEDDVVGTGEVYPMVSYFNGRRIHSRNVLVRILTVREDFKDQYETGFQVWAVDLISRCNLLNAFQQLVGSAIVAVRELSAGGPTNRICGAEMDISQAIIVYDIRINESHKSDVYGFSEWYRFGAPWVKHIGFEEICKYAAPKTLSDFSVLHAGFWHQEYIKECA